METAAAILRPRGIAAAALIGAVSAAVHVIEVALIIAILRHNSEEE